MKLQRPITRCLYWLGYAWHQKLRVAPRNPARIICAGPENDNGSVTRNHYRFMRSWFYDARSRGDLHKKEYLENVDTSRTRRPAKRKPTKSR